jgi:geranylgeranyl diphosphate synthase type II
VKSPFDQFADTYKPIIEQALLDALPTDPGDPRMQLTQAMRYSLTAKAKRIRPLLCIASFLMFHDDVSRILPVATALEMIHSYSLIHDDLPAMDDDDLRRGMPTCHVKFGEDIAILAGDTLNTLAFEILTETLLSHYSAPAILRAINELSKACGVYGMAGGQVMDLKKPESLVDDTYIHRLHALKTGALIRASITIPAILEQSSEEILMLLTQFGNHAGVLFQMVDDILDVIGSKEELGKTPQKDIKQDKLTFISLYGLETSKTMALHQAELGKKILSELSKTSLNTSPLLAIIDYLVIRTH